RLSTVLIRHCAVFGALGACYTVPCCLRRLRPGKNGSSPYSTPSGRFLRLPAAERWRSAAAGSGSAADAGGSQLQCFVRPSSASCHSPEINPKTRTKRNSRYLASQLNDFRDRSFAVVRTHPPTRNELNSVFGKVRSSRI